MMSGRKANGATVKSRVGFDYEQHLLSSTKAAGEARSGRLEISAMIAVDGKKVQLITYYFIIVVNYKVLICVHVNIHVRVHITYHRYIV